MSKTAHPPPPPVRVAGPVSIARLHAEACFYRRAVTKTLTTAGTIVVAGVERVWPIVTCGHHTTVAW
ncbi:hypothetical protein AB0O07_22300 [Streptomyces sp. NPDC093085]|uniref:hypothetical protein n=1 Tax=Streptomyces sp. NPDC093085 TaxID=3155068 RepID=UPI0034421DE9